MYGSRSTPYPSFKVRIQESSFESAIVGKTFCGPMARHLERWVSSSIFTAQLRRGRRSQSGLFEAVVLELLLACLPAFTIWSPLWVKVVRRS